ncbi:acyltransferase family protein [Duganella sp. FT80W]|uniref:Acyltransferase family protein n=1 Tax=Duganella guangzhouensis TaxID=2666084 RepID=A0A6I2L5K1_9BURK|nr:acyltransferase [Duganella guangzhouensis]MRW93050.1 acyltransferase family protein [Duganella guangzhouensis]
MVAQIQEKHRYEYLDALRGVAALAVCFHHIFGYIYKAGQMDEGFNTFVRTSILEVFDFGRFGVVLFFLISGFIIPTSLRPGTTLKKFTITRIFRLYPAFWAACLLIFVSAPYLGDSTVSVKGLFANLTMVPKFFHEPEISGVFWTLFVEIMFYFCCAVLFQLSWLENPRVIGGVALVLGLITPLAVLLNHLVHLNMAIRFIPFHLSFLFVGSIFRLAIVKKDNQAKIISAFLVIFIIFTVPLTCGLFFNVPEALATDFVMHGALPTTASYFIAIAIFLIVIISKPKLGSFLSEQGKISYSLYLLHMLCFVTVYKVIQPTTLVSCFEYIIVSALLAFSAAKLSYKFIESPAISLGRMVVSERRISQA